MNFYNDLSKWNNFLNEELLIESRLKAAVKKFPEIDQEIIKQLSLSDPSGKNAYLMWMTQAMKDSGAGVYDVPGLAGERIFDIVPIVTDFHKAKQRISQLNKNRKKDGKSLYPNDINQFKSLDQLENFIDDIGLSSSEEKRKEVINISNTVLIKLALPKKIINKKRKPHFQHPCVNHSNNHYDNHY